MKYNSNEAELMRKKYSPGTRMKLIAMNDPYDPVPPGTEGTLDFIDDACQMHMKWDNGRTLALIPGEDRFSIVLPPLQTLRLYMPLTVNAHMRNEYGDLENDLKELHADHVLKYEDIIASELLREQLPEEAERGLMVYYSEDDSVNHKVKSYVFKVERVANQLMGVAECQVYGELSEKELEQLKEDVSNQAADGLGKGVEQRPIKTEEGEMYVSLWNSGKSWSLLTQEEMERNMQMGGMKIE